MSADADNRQVVREAFRPWEQGDPGPFFDLVADDVHWTVIGTSPLSGVFQSKQALFDHSFNRLLDRLDGPLTTTLVDVSADGDKVFLQFESTGASTTGVDYHQVYCFAMTMRQHRIVEVIAYLDTGLLSAVMA